MAGPIDVVRRADEGVERVVRVVRRIPVAVVVSVVLMAQLLEDALSEDDRRIGVAS